MIRLTDEQWGRIRNHFPEEHIADGRLTEAYRQAGIYAGGQLRALAVT